MNPTTPPPPETGPSFGWGFGKSLLIGFGFLAAGVILFAASTQSLSNVAIAKVALGLGTAMFLFHLVLTIRLANAVGVPSRHRSGLWVGAAVWWAVLFLNPLSLCAMVMCSESMK